MNQKMNTIVLAALVACSAQALADDTSMTAAQKDQMMKQCMEKQKASNSSMTQAAMETVCKNELKKMQKSGNDLATGPQAPKPQP